MNRNKLLFVTFGVLVLGGLWALFRPELFFIDNRVEESLPGGGPAFAAADGGRVIRSGTFHGNAHSAKGTASIHQLPDGKRLLRLTDFETSNGPDLALYLVAAQDSTDNDTVTNSGFVSLGSLKGNVGDQNYDLPSDLDLAKYQSVTVWCRRFGVNFATAPLVGTVQ